MFFTLSWCFLLSCSISFHELSWGLFESMVESYIARTSPDRFPGDEAVTNLLCLICMEREIPLRFYQEDGGVLVEFLDPVADVDWVCLFDEFTSEYFDILLPEPRRDVRAEFYSVIEDSLQ